MNIRRLIFISILLTAVTCCKKKQAAAPATVSILPGLAGMHAWHGITQTNFERQDSSGAWHLIDTSYSTDDSFAILVLSGSRIVNGFNNDTLDYLSGSDSDISFSKYLVGFVGSYYTVIDTMSFHYSNHAITWYHYDSYDYTHKSIFLHSP